ncbi:MAG: amidohydrolase family protein [Gemmatimonadota bacterium]|nr:amidohydrolase family protein [Gemmatimonadota bacterium]
MTRTRFVLSFITASIAVASNANAQASGAAPRRVVLRAAHVIEPRTGKRIDNAVIVVDGDRITSVTAGGAASSGVAPAGTATTIDLGDVTVLPGLIDVHTHLTSESHDYYTDLFRHSPIDDAVRAHVYAKRTLEAGFTTVRDVGAAELIDVALRNAINEGVVEGPHMLVATMPLSATGGHGDLNGFSPYLHFQQLSSIADGVDEVRKQVRVDIKYGADWIKVLASAGVLSEEESVGAPQYSQEELNAIVTEAAQWGRKVAAHAHGTEAIKRATRAGVASIEHGGLVDEEGVRLMKEHGTYLVPDIYTDAYILDHGKELGLPDKIIEKERQLRKAQNVNWRRAIAAGVKMAFGTDAGVYPHGTNARQFKYLLELGLTPLQTIQMATSNAADLLGWQDKVGTLAPGAWADLIAVKGDPLSDVTVLERPSFVMKGGTVYRSAPASDSAVAH